VQQGNCTGYFNSLCTCCWCHHVCTDAVTCVLCTCVLQVLGRGEGAVPRKCVGYQFFDLVGGGGCGGEGDERVVSPMPHCKGSMSELATANSCVADHQAWWQPPAGCDERGYVILLARALCAIHLHNPAECQTYMSILTGVELHGHSCCCTVPAGHQPFGAAQLLHHD
jgi:hypothetical protein